MFCNFWQVSTVLKQILLGHQVLYAIVTIIQERPNWEILLRFCTNLILVIDLRNRFFKNLEKIHLKYLFVLFLYSKLKVKKFYGKTFHGKIIFMVNFSVALGSAVLFPKYSFKLHEDDDFCIGNDRLERFARLSMLWLVYYLFWKHYYRSKTLYSLSVSLQYMQ